MNLIYLTRRSIVENLKYCKNFEPITISKVFHSSVAKKPLYNINTNVAKDVILYKYDNTKFFKYMNYFAVGQYIMWAYLGSFAFSTLRDAPVDQSKITKDTPWFKRVNLGEKKYRIAIGSAAVIIGEDVIYILLNI